MTEKELQHGRDITKEARSRPLSEEEVSRACKRIKIHTDVLLSGGLTVEHLKNEGVAPSIVCEHQGEEVAMFSRPYKLKNILSSVMYVPDESDLIARTVMLSRSHSVWRYVIRVMSGWMDKGWEEQSIGLPAHLQKPLSEVSSIGQRQANVTNPNRIFTGTTRSWGNVDLTSYRRDIEMDPRRLGGNFYDYSHLFGEPQRIDPEKLVFTNRDEEPNFHDQLRMWIQDHPSKGPIVARTVSSNDQSLAYTFCRDKWKRRWIGLVEDLSSEGTTMGLNRKWVDGGGLVTPVDEYESQAGDDGGEQYIPGYVDMYKEYISKIPIIRKYCEFEESQPNRSLNPVEASIQGALNFEHLYAILKYIGSISGSQKVFDSNELISIIDRVRRGEADICEITDTHFLRNKVRRLLITEGI